MVRVGGAASGRTSNHVVARLLLLLSCLLLGLRGHPVGLIGQTSACYVGEWRSDHVTSLTLLLTRPHIDLPGSLRPHRSLTIGVPWHVVLGVGQWQAQGKVSSVKVSLSRLRLVTEVLLILASCIGLLWAILVSDHPWLLLLVLLWLSRLTWCLLLLCLLRI